MDTKTKIIKYLSLSIKIGKFKLSHKDTASTLGILSMMLIVQGSILILEDTIFSIFKILYAFLVLLPCCYYNMREYEKELTYQE